MNNFKSHNHLTIIVSGAIALDVVKPSTKTEKKCSRKRNKAKKKNSNKHRLDKLYCA